MPAPFSEQFLATYTELTPLGEGGMARVYRARDVRLDRPVAIKVLKEVDEAQAARFRREARTLASLEHPHILRVYDADCDGATPYLVCELVDGQPLDAIARDGPLDRAGAVRAALEVGAALAYAHARGVVHRDVKPENVLVTQDGMHKLADFGLARPITAGHTVTSAEVVMGTPEFLAPELIEGTAPAASGDQYALGVMLYLLVTRRLPFRGESAAEQLRARIGGAPESPSRHVPVPPALERVMLRMLARDPGKRFPSVADACDALRSATGLAPARKRSGASKPAAGSVTRASKLYLGLVGAGLVAGFGATAWWLRAPLPVAIVRVSPSAAPSPGYTNVTAVLRHPRFRGRNLSPEEVRELRGITGMQLGSDDAMYRDWYELADWIEGRRERPPRFGRSSPGPIDGLEEPLFIRGVNDAEHREPLALSSIAIRCCAMNPEDTRPWFLLGRALWLEGRPAEARRVLAHALTMRFTCGGMEWPVQVAAGYVHAQMELGTEDRLFEQIAACPKFARAVWVGARDALARDDARCAALLRRGMGLAGQEGPAAAALAQLLVHHRGEYAQARSLLEGVLARDPENLDVRQMLLNFAWERGDEAQALVLLPPLAGRDLMHRDLPALLFGPPGPPAAMQVEKRDDEPYVRNAYTVRLLEAGQPADAQAAVHEVRQRWAPVREVLARIDVHLHDRNQCPAPRLEALRAALARGVPRVWSELAGAVAIAPGGPAQRLLAEVEGTGGGAFGQLARALIASRRGDHGAALAALAATGATIERLPPELVLEVAARAVFAGAPGQPLARALRTDHRLLRELAAELGAGDLDRAAKAAERLFLVDPELSPARFVLLADAERHGAARACARRLRASGRALAVEIWRLAELSRLAESAR